MIEPLKPQQDPFIYSVSITILSGLFLIYASYYYTSALVWTTFIFAIGLVVSFLIYNTRCPLCKRPFVKEEERHLREKLREEIRPYTYYDKIQYLYSDGTPKEIVNDKQHTINEHWEVNRYHYKCKKCEHKWVSKETPVNLDINIRPKPHIRTIQTKEKNPIGAGFGLGGDFERNGGRIPQKERIPIPSEIRNKVMRRAGHKCQVCGKSIHLKIHHIDHNPSNNSPGNLIVLCPTHHAEADTNALRREQLYSLRDRQATSGRVHYT